jgi:hypothetical protein
VELGLDCMGGGGFVCVGEQFIFQLPRNADAYYCGAKETL